MAETCLKHFKVAIEVTNYVCYVKYVDKKNSGISKDLVDDLYDLLKNKINVISKKDIEKLLSFHMHHLTPSMFKDDKFNLCYNAITEKFIIDENELSDSYEAPFVIKTKSDMVKRYNKDEFMNHFTDMYHNSLFLLDIRYYGLEKKYYEVEFDLYLNEEALIIKSQEPLYVDYLLEQYNMNQIVDMLGLTQPINHKGHVLTPESISNDSVESVYPFNKKTILDHLVECYETSHCVFINQVFMKSFNIDLDDLITELNQPKLIFVLEENANCYSERSLNNQIDRIEYKDGNTIVHISEHLFRESCGNSSYILLMNELYHTTLNQLGPSYFQFPYIAKCHNKNMNLFHNILNKYFDSKRLNSYIDNLFIWIFVLEEEELNSNLNYYLVNSFRSSAFSIRRFNYDSRDALPFKDLKKLVQIYRLGSKISKKIELTTSNVKLLFNDMVNMIGKLNSLESIDEFISVIEEVIQVFNIDEKAFEEDIVQIYTLIDIKRVIFLKEQDINFLLDTSVIIDEPDLFHKYFNDKSIIVPSIISDELENYRVNNINAVRAIRNINLLKNESNSKFQYITEDSMFEEFTKPHKVKVFQDLMHQYSQAGKQIVLVSNDKSYDLYKNNKNHFIQLKHIPVLFN
ncbi:hypothetical protein KHQ81_09750 [Mycoplasmatota bacterium]|nr:hypothetical protein KHQ81_09750 [Mycoplasmatota bacterium]